MGADGQVSRVGAGCPDPGPPSHPELGSLPLCCSLSGGLIVSITLVERVRGWQPRCHGNLHSTHLTHTSCLAKSRQRSQTGICPLVSPVLCFPVTQWIERWAVGSIGVKLCHEGRTFVNFQEKKKKRLVAVKGRAEEPGKAG